MSSKKRTVLVTGGYGFIGSNFIHMILKSSTNNIKIINLDANTYAGNPENVSEFIGNENFTSYKGRIEDTDHVNYICRTHNVEGIINFAAESHVDRSIQDFKPFLDTNVIGTLSLLTVAKELKLKKFVQVSTDEVYGSLDLDSDEKFTENSQISPNSPYSAAKAAADGFVRSFYHTYGVPAVITRCSNNYGPRQFPEKLIPLMILNVLDGKPLPIYGDGLNVRDWIHVDDHCSAVWAVYERGKNGEVYNIGSDNEWSNGELVRKILSIMDKWSAKIEYVNDRLGHDRRYAIDSSKAKKELGWEPSISFEDGIKSTIDWYLKNKNFK
jgi:dTDP-glucose 4,6-dehydratase